MDYNLTADLAGNLSEEDGAALPTYGLVSFQILISAIYSLVCAVGLLGNFFVMYLIKSKKANALTPIDVFVFCLALSDFQFAFTLPFWAGDAIRDSSWPFGHPMCKIVLTVTVMSVYNNVFLLTSMAVTRYWSVASAPVLRYRVSPGAAKWISFVLWVLALLATVPTIIFAGTKEVLGVELCLLKFPENKWLAIYHAQRVIMAFVIPLVVITTSYAMLLSFLRRHRVNANNQQRQSRITNSVQLVIIVFFICWFPNHAGIFWGILVKLQVVEWSDAYYYFHTYVYPITICLAHSNSCLNPIIYCLMRKEFRQALKALFWQLIRKVTSFLPSGKRVGAEQDTAMPLYRGSQLSPVAGKGSHRPPSVSSITVVAPKNSTKDQSRQSGTSTGQEISVF
ncbi:relaxin-3 receptor 2 [Gastrophryne carolinensis]